MKTPAFNATLLFYPNKNPTLRLLALWYFTVLMIVWNILGHTVLGFEQSHAATIVALGTAVFAQFFLEWVDAAAGNRAPRFAGSRANFINALPAALIPGFACSMLLYPNERLWPVIFAVVLSIGSKALIRAPIGNGRTQHVFNPSNFGVGLTLLLFPQVGFAPPYHFTSNVTAVWDWIIPGFILLTGVVVHGFFTGRLPLVAAWLAGFALQGQLRAYFYGFPHIVPVMPMTSAAFIVFTLYMVPDPATTPLKPGRQVAFGLAVAMVYGLIQIMHLVFGLFFALLAVCAIRGASLWLHEKLRSPAPAPAALPRPVPGGLVQPAT